MIWGIVLMAILYLGTIMVLMEQTHVDDYISAFFTMIIGIIKRTIDIALIFWCFKLLGWM